MTFVLLLLSVWLLLKPLLHFPNFPVGYYLRPHTQRQTGTPTWPRQHAGHTHTQGFCFSLRCWLDLNTLRSFFGRFAAISCGLPKCRTGAGKGERKGESNAKINRLPAAWLGGIRQLQPVRLLSFSLPFQLCLANAHGKSRYAAA